MEEVPHCSEQVKVRGRELTTASLLTELCQVPYTSEQLFQSLCTGRFSLTSAVSHKDRESHKMLLLFELFFSNCVVWIDKKISPLCYTKCLHAKKKFITSYNECTGEKSHTVAIIFYNNLVCWHSWVCTHPCGITNFVITDYKTLTEKIISSFQLYRSTHTQ